MSSQRRVNDGEKSSLERLAYALASAALGGYKTGHVEVFDEFPNQVRRAIAEASFHAQALADSTLDMGAGLMPPNKAGPQSMGSKGGETLRTRQRSDHRQKRGLVESFDCGMKCLSNNMSISSPPAPFMLRSRPRPRSELATWYLNNARLPPPSTQQRAS